MIIIGITGTIGAGKGTIVDYLKDRHAFDHHSVRSYLTKIIEQRNLPLNRDSMVAVANELRAQNSPSFIVEELYRKAAASKRNCIIESIRTPGEIDALAGLSGFYLFAVDAKPEIRYKRIVERNTATDQINFDTFVANEKREMTSTDPNKQNLAACIQRADFKFENDSSFDDLFTKVGDVLKQILK